MTDPRVMLLRERFRTLHASGCFVIPNPWDIGSARLLVKLGFPALATTSSGFAWSTGRRDNHITLDDALAHVRAIASSVEVPVNADFEGGFAIDPEGVAANVARAADTGIAGISIEDSTGDSGAPLFDFDLSVRRVAAARQAAHRPRYATPPRALDSRWCRSPRPARPVRSVRRFVGRPRNDRRGSRPRSHRCRRLLPRQSRAAAPRTPRRGPPASPSAFSPRPGGEAPSRDATRSPCVKTRYRARTDSGPSHQSSPARQWSHPRADQTV